MPIAPGELMVFVDGAPLRQPSPEGVRAGPAGHNRLTQAHRARAHARLSRPPLRPVLPPPRADAPAGRLCRGAARPGGAALHRQEPRGPRHLAGDADEREHRRRHRQARLLGRRQHPRRRADRQHRLPVLAAPPGQPLRRRRRGRPPGDAAAGHAHRLHRAAPQPRRRRAGAGRLATAHPQRHPALSLRRTACRRPDGGRHRRRRPRADDAHRRPARRLEEAPAGAAPAGAARARRLRRRVLPRHARGPAEELRRAA